MHGNHVVQRSWELPGRGLGHDLHRRTSQGAAEPGEHRRCLQLRGHGAVHPAPLRLQRRREAGFMEPARGGAGHPPGEELLLSVPDGLQGAGIGMAISKPRAVHDLHHLRGAWHVLLPGHWTTAGPRGGRDLLRGHCPPEGLTGGPETSPHHRRRLRNNKKELTYVGSFFDLVGYSFFSDSSAGASS